MSLRWRLAALFAAVAALAAGLSAGVSYVTTSRQMTGEVDHAVVQAVGFLTQHPDNLDEATRPQNPPQTNPAPTDSSGDGDDPSGPAGPGGPGGILDQVAVQRLNPSGKVLARSGIAIPVTAADRAVAAGSVEHLLRTETLSEVQYRVATAHVPTGGAVQVAESLSQRDRVLDGLRWRFGLLALLVALLGALLGWLVARRLTRPLEVLTVATEELAETGHSTQPLEVSRADEVGRLSRSFTEMLDALRESRDQQHQLVRDAGHELRTPITSLRTNIELLERHDASLTSAQRATLLDHLDGELSELTVLVEEIIDLATDRAEEEEPEALDLEVLVRRVAQQAERRHHRPVVVEAAPWEITGQRRAIERALSNLVENAAKFAPGNSPIEVRAIAPELSVRDHGPGIAPGDEQRIFRRFYRAESSKGLPGSGLGLSIVATVAEAQGASTFARNEPDGGARIGLRF